MDFRWTRWNVEHLSRHGVDPESAEEVVRWPTKGFPRRIGDKWLSWGTSPAGELLQVVFLVDEDGAITGT